MPTAVKWAGYTDRGTVLSTELNSLANDAISSLGTALANQTNKDQYATFELSVTFGTAPSTGGYVNLYEVIAPDGTNDGSSANAVQMRLVCAIPVHATTSAQRLHSGLVTLRPARSKYALENKSGQAFPSSGSTVKVFTTNDEIQ